ncbi:MAG: DMT family transporter [Pseudomonadota bacterium]
MQADRPIIGILLMLGFCALAPVGDSLAKLLGSTIPILQLVLVRFAVQALVLVPLVLIMRKSLRLSRRAYALTLLRTALHIVGIGAMFTSLLYLPLADAIAIAFVMPFIMLLLGKFVLGEEIGSRRLGACCVGFIGTLFVVQPSFATVGAPALLPLLVAVVFALFMLVTRQIAKEADPISLQAVSGLMAVPLLLAPYLLFADIAPEILALASPNPLEAWLMLAIGLVGTLAHLLMVWSLRFAPSATVAPVQYLEIPFATLMGYFIFKDWPNGLAMLGICITMAAGLYILNRERRADKISPAAA